MADDWCCKGTDPSCDGPQECVNRAALLIEAQQAEIERLRVAGDALHAAVRNHNLTEAHLRAWEEARRG